jgi:hypothetical protein
MQEVELIVLHHFTIHLRTRNMSVPRVTAEVPGQNTDDFSLHTRAGLV